MVKVVKSYSQIFLLVMVFGLCFQSSAHAEQADHVTLVQKLKIARAECATYTYPAGQANTLLIECENAAVRTLTKGQFDPEYQNLVNEFLNNRVLIARQLDRQNIDYSDYSKDIADAADHFDKKVSELECTRSASCSQ